MSKINVKTEHFKGIELLGILIRNYFSADEVEELLKKYMTEEQAQKEAEHAKS